MPVAAVPHYLGRDFSRASPGLRFGMYLPIWGVDNRTGEPIWSTHDLSVRVSGPGREERVFEDVNKTAALRQAVPLTAGDIALMKALAVRQDALVAARAAVDAVLVIDARSSAPFATGLGNAHPLENGFAFLNPYGLPYLAGSSVKGVLRQAACELADGLWGQPHGWDPSAIDVLFGPRQDGGDGLHRRGALGFRDVIPDIAGNALQVEVMTPHQSHYLQSRSVAGSDSPHDSGQPNPIAFLAVPPGSRFVFVIDCDLPFLRRLAPELAGYDRWKRLIEAGLALAFDWLGFGAKTAVGYGAMARDEEALRVRAQAAAAAEDTRRRATLSAERLAIEDFVGWMSQRAEQLRGGKERANGEAQSRAGALARRALEDVPAWSAEDRLAAADAIEHWLPRVVSLPNPKDALRKLRLRQLKGLA